MNPKNTPSIVPELAPDAETDSTFRRLAGSDTGLAVLRAISELAVDAAYVIQYDLNGNCTLQWVAGDPGSLTGYAPQELQDPELLRGLIHPDDRPAAYHYLKTIPSERTAEASFRIVTKSGQTVWVRDVRRQVTTPAADRGPIVIGGLQAMTAETAEDSELRQWVERYRSVTQNLREAILVIQNSRPVFVNRRAAEITGYSEQELMSRTFNQLIHPDDRAAVTEGHQTLLGGGATEQPCGFRIINPLEDVKWVEANTTVIDWDGQPAVLASVADVSFRQWLEEALQERNQVLALLNEVGQQLNASLDLSQTAGQLRKLAKELIGAEGASVWLWEDGKQWLVCCTRFDEMGPDAPASLRLRPGQGIAGWVALTGESVVAPVPRDDPRFFRGIDEQTNFTTHSLIAVPLRVRGEVIGVMEVVNKTEGKFDEDDLVLSETLASTAAIAISNAQLIDELHRQTLELQAHTEDLDTFVDTVAHDLKNLLAQLVFHSSILESDVDGVPSELREHLRTIRQYAEKMGKIIDASLLLATVREANGLELAPLDMNRLLVDVQSCLANIIRESKAQITLPDEWPAAIGYSPWIERVWSNYISNAIQYGGSPPILELGARVTEDQKSVLFWIRDNGTGLRVKDQARLFTPFTQLHGERSRGHGLGLSIVKRIVEKLGGRVGVESSPGKGSVFTFTLPRATLPPSD